MKLELKHLASYLPYGLKVSNQFGVFELLGIRNKSNTNNNLMLSYKLHSDIVWGYDYQNKPILRPLSDLTKEIDGVVHLVELAKIQCECDILDYKLQSKVIGGISAFGINYINDDYGSMVFGYDTFNGFGLHIKPMNDVLFVSNQIKLYNYLFEHHFDIYGLISKGLAIDINTIK